MKTLICMVGLPRSGKSTWARTQNFPIVNSDSIRLALYGHTFIGVAEPMVWVIADIMVRALFFSGHSHVVLDATNITKEVRDNWKSDDWDTFYKVISTPVEICLGRTTGSEAQEIISMIEKMAEQFEPLAEGEREWK